jgi:hypothetical protein
MGAKDEYERLASARSERERMLARGVRPADVEPDMHVPRGSGIAWNVFATLLLIGLAVGLYAWLGPKLGLPWIR